MLLLHRLCKRLALLFPEGGVSIFRQASIGTALVRVRFHRQWHISVISANALLPASPTPIVQTSSPVFLEKIWMIDRPAVSGQPFLRHIDQCQKVDIGFAILFSAGIGAIEQQLLQLISENTLQSGMNFVQDGRKLCGSYHVRSPLLRLNTRTLSMEAGTKPKSRCSFPSVIIPTVAAKIKGAKEIISFLHLRPQHVERFRVVRNERTPVSCIKPCEESRSTAAAYQRPFPN